MLPYNWNHWTTDIEYIDLLDFIIEKTENVESPMNISQLARDFKAKSRAAKTTECLTSRIKKLRPIIHSFEHIETDTKVRILYALGASINEDYLQELSRDALVEVDVKNRITHYKSERLELEGYHCLSTRDTNNYLTTDEKSSDLLNYLIKITESVELPMNLSQLAIHFKEYSGSFKTMESLQQRIKRLSTKIHSFEHIDKNTKVKLLFALSAPVSANFLEELKERAFVEVDEKYRITYYESIIDGLKLRGYHSPAKQAIELSGLKRSLLSTIDETWGSCSSKRTPDYNPIHSFKDQPRFELQKFPGSMNELLADDQIKLESFRGIIQEDFKEIIKYEDIQQIPRPTQALYEHNQFMEVPIKVEKEEPFENSTEPLEVKAVQTLDEHNEPLEVPIKEEQEELLELKPETSHNSKIKFFEAMQSLILCLDTSSLSWIQSKIHQKIETIVGTDEVILNNEIFLIIDSLIARMANRSEVNLSKNVESVKLSYFLCYLKAAILSSKMCGLESLVKNISKLIEESQNERIPMEEVANALHSTLNIDGF